MWQSGRYYSTKKARGGIIGVILGRGYTMTKSDEELVERAGADFTAKLRSKIDEYRELDGEGKLNIDRIEVMWSLARQASDEVLKEVYTELVNSTGEKKLLKKKEKN
jgi:hypothetical protein